MRFFRHLVGIASLSSIMAMAPIGYANQAHAEEINWSEYMQSAYVVAAIAAAISRVEHCSKKPLLIEEIRSSEDKRSLVFTCAGTEDEESSSILHLERLDNGWRPTGFDLAG